MINRACGIVMEVFTMGDNLEKVKVLVGDNINIDRNDSSDIPNVNEAWAYSFPEQTGNIKRGDRVILNTTAVDLNLGSGGFHFIMGRCPSGVMRYNKKGHILKLRYTPFQLKVLAVDEEDSTYRDIMVSSSVLEGVPVIGGSLHSMLVPCVCGLKSVRQKLKIAYVMTDGVALPLNISTAVRDLKKHKLLCGTVTIGHAYGGDLEAVNLYSGLLAAKSVLQAQVIIVLMGPGVVGTGTIWGNTALEVGQIINAVNSLEGVSYTIPRLSFADQRERHIGISHHTITALNRVALSSTKLVLPKIIGFNENKEILRQLEAVDQKKHQIVWGNGEQGIQFAKEMGLGLSHMGRGYDDDPVFFLGASAVGETVAREVMD